MQFLGPPQAGGYLAPPQFLGPPVPQPGTFPRDAAMEALGAMLGITAGAGGAYPSAPGSALDPAIQTAMNARPPVHATPPSYVAIANEIRQRQAIVDQLRQIGAGYPTHTAPPHFVGPPISSQDAHWLPLPNARPRSDAAMRRAFTQAVHNRSNWHPFVDHTY